MNTTSAISTLYLVTGLILPFFYLPQIIKLYNDTTRLGSYSFAKATAQLLLRLPALMFAVVVVQSPYMNIVLIFDVLGRVAEWMTAVHAMKKQAFTNAEMIERVFPYLAKMLSKNHKSDADTPQSQHGVKDGSTPHEQTVAVLSPVNAEKHAQVN